MYCFFSSGQSDVHSLRISGPPSQHCCVELFLDAKLYFAFAASASVPAVEAGMKAEVRTTRAEPKATYRRLQGIHMV